jgi:hypothetical protein
LEVNCWSEDIFQQLSSHILKTIHNPTSPPNPLKNNDVKDNISAPHSLGIAPPIVEPIKIAIQIKAPVIGKKLISFGLLFTPQSSSQSRGASRFRLPA